MQKEIKIEKNKPIEEYEIEFDNTKEVSSRQIPVGHKLGGNIWVAKPQPEYIKETNKTEEATENIKDLFENHMIKENEEKRLTEMFNNDINPRELSENIESVSGKYKPGACVDKEIESKRLSDELEIARYFTKQYRENVRKLFSEMTDDHIRGVLNGKKREEIDEIIEEMVRPNFHRQNCKCKMNDNEGSSTQDNLEKNEKPEKTEATAVSFDTICEEIVMLHRKKNKDYDNAADNSYKEFGLVSYVIRLNDKLNRLKSLAKPGVTAEVKDESIEDTLMDLASYAIMAIESLRN